MAARESSELAADLLSRAVGSPSSEAFLRGAIPLVAAAVGGEYAALVCCHRGRWQVLAAAGAEREPPGDLLPDALDAEAPVAREGWWATRLDRRSLRNEILVAKVAQGIEVAARRIAAAAELLNASLEAARERERQQRRIERLEAILKIADQWNQTLEMDRLLEDIARASTRLLGAERASIFLWDRPNKTLVARPALGVEGNELRIPDQMGVVGQVIHTGHPRHINDEEEGQIDRHVDRQLGFRTRSLLCVPLRGKSGELLGAFELINKTSGDFTDEDEDALTELASRAAIALENSQQYERLLRARNQMADQAAEGVQLLGHSPAIEALRATMRRVADTELAVLLLGENGTGKEVVGQCIHYWSRRRHHPFVAVNCAALAETLLESELFGHEKGAFTDAHATRPGKFELASGGTLFLDEIGDMSPGGQSKLLRVLEEKVVVRVGGSTPISTDTRVIAATNQNLAEAVRSKRFREDLYYRLNVVTLELPPLRDRGDDIVLLAEHFLRQFSAKARRKPPALTPSARRRLLQHPWPGNVRELRNLMERLAYLSTGDTIDQDEISFILSPRTGEPGLFSSSLPLVEATRQFQSDYIQMHIARAGGNMTEAASRLGLHRSNLYRKMRQLGMETREP